MLRLVFFSVFMLLAVYSQANNGETKCNAGDAKACFDYAYQLTRSDGVKAMQFFDKSCRMGYANGCAGVAHGFFGNIKGVKRDDNQVYAYGVQACKMNSNYHGCYMAAVVAFENKKDINAGRDLILHGCKVNDPKACDFGAEIYSTGKYGIAQDGQMAFNFAERGCNLGMGNACVLTGWLMQGNMGVKADLKGAQAYYNHGCKIGNEMACYNGGMLFWNDPAALTTYSTQIKNSFEKGCELKDAPSCIGLSALHIKQGNLLQSIGSAEKSCQLKYTPACDYAKELKEYQKELIAYEQAMQQYNAKVATVSNALDNGDFNGALNIAVNQMGDREQAARVVMAAESAGKSGTLADTYIYNLLNWFTGPAGGGFTQANAVVQREYSKIKRLEKEQQNKFRIVPTPKPSTSENVTVRIMKGGRMFQENMSRSHFEKYYKP